MAIQKHTLTNALAYMVITDSTRYLTRSTHSAMMPYYEFKVPALDADAGGRCYHVTPEGMVLARTSRLWKAHEELVARGFRVARHGKHKIGFIRYVHRDDAERHAWTSNRGDVYVAPEGKRWASELVASFKNG